MKTNFIWGTDIHLDCLGDDENNDAAVAAWAEQNLATKDADSILLTGDISLGPDVIRHLKIIKERTKKKVFYVLGNHDFWNASISKLRLDITQPELMNDGIVWLGSVDYVPFGESIALIGHDGWYDALNGDFKTSRFIMKDWFNIEEFSSDLRNIVPTARKLAAEAVFHIEKACTKAIAEGRKRIIMLTHFPPFVEACFYRGKRTETQALPWYSSRLMGEALLALSEKHPETNFTVLCGHTHSAADVTIRPNLRVVVGHSDYGSPDSNMIGVTE